MVTPTETERLLETEYMLPPAKDDADPLLAESHSCPVVVSPSLLSAWKEAAGDYYSNTNIKVDTLDILAPVLVLLALTSGWLWRRRRGYSSAARIALECDVNPVDAAKVFRPASPELRRYGYSECDTESTGSLTSDEGSHNGSDVHMHMNYPRPLPQLSDSMFGGQFCQDEHQPLDDFETFENEPLQDIVADAAHNEQERHRLLQIEEQTRHLLLALGGMFQTSVEENRNSVHRMVHQEMQSRDERLTHQEYVQQEQCSKLETQVHKLQMDLQQAMARNATLAQSAVQHSTVQSLLGQVQRLEKELQQEREILDKAVISTQDGHLEKGIAALVNRVQQLEALQTAKAGGETQPTSGLEQRIHKLEQELQQEKERNGAAGVNRDLLLQKALADLTDQVEDLEEKLEDTKDVNDATTSILETRLHLQVKAQEMAVENLEQQVKTVSSDLLRVDMENKDSIAQVRKDQQEQGAQVNSKLQSLEDKLSSFQEEWETVLQGLQSWDDKLASFKKSQEKATELLSLQLEGLEGELQQASKQTDKKQEAIKASAAAAIAAMSLETAASPKDPQPGLAKKRLQFWRSKTTKPDAKVAATVAAPGSPVAVNPKVANVSEGSILVGGRTMFEA